MIKTEKITIGSRKFVRTYSDRNMMIERDKVKYAEAIDPIEFADERIYSETDIPIESEEYIDG